MLLWTQLKSCLELMKKARENRVTTPELVRRRKILEQRQDHLMLMKKRSRLEPVMEQKEVEYVEVEHLCEEVNKLGRFSLDPSKCEVTFPTAMTVMNKESLLMVTLRDVNGDTVDDRSSEVKVSVVTKTAGAIFLGPVKDISGGNYTVSFTPTTLGDHVMSAVVDGQHIPGSPHKLVIVCVLLECFVSDWLDHCSSCVSYKMLSNRFIYDF